MRRVQICFTADDDVISSIDEIAKQVKRSRSETINTILFLWLATHRKERLRNFGELILREGSK